MFLLQAGALSVLPGKKSVIVPILIPAYEIKVEIQTNEQHPKIYEIDWTSNMYILEENMYISLVKGQIFFLLVRYSLLTVRV